MTATKPDYITPEDLANHLGWSPRELRKKAREIGACRIMGNAMILTTSDVDAILEASRPCPLISSSVAKFGTIEARSTAQDYAELQALLTKKLPSKSLPASKQRSGKVILMGQNRP